MKILVTCDPGLPVPPLQYGGVERMVSGVCRGFREAGHEVYLLASRGSREKNVQEIFFWPADSSRGGKNIARNAWCLFRLANRLKPDVIHSFSRMLFLYPLLCQGKFFVVESFGRSLSPKTLKWAGMVDHRKKLFFSACAKHMLNVLPETGRWRVIGNFLDMDYFQPLPPEFPREDYLVFLGMICRQKGTDLAIEVAGRTGKKLLIAGIPGDLATRFFETRIAPKLSEKVQYIGPVDDAQKRTLLQHAQGLLFPITGPEAFGLVVIESMACGTPVIGLNRYSVPELIEDGVNGFIAEDLSGMEKAVGGLGQLSPDRIRQSVQDRFDYRHICRQYLQYFEDIRTK